MFACRANPEECELEQWERILAHEIYFEKLSLNGVRSTIVFLSEQENPGTFLLDGQVRVAKTGNDPNDDIFVNRDLIVESSAFGGYQPISVGQMLAILAHEYGHHHHSDQSINRVFNHEDLDRFGNKLRVWAESNVIRQEVGHEWPVLDQANSERVFVNIFETRGSRGARQDRSHLLISGPFGAYDLSDLPKSRVACPRAYYLDELDFEGYPFAIHFNTLNFVSPVVNGNELVIGLKVDSAAFFCLNQIPPNENTYQVFDRYRDGSVKFYFEKSASGVIFKIDRTDFEMTVPPDTHWY